MGNAGVREWEGEPELNLNDSTTVAIADETVEVDQEVGGDRSLVDIAAGDRGRNVEVRVLEVDEKTISGRDGETEILEGVVGDATAKLPSPTGSPAPNWSRAPTSGSRTCMSENSAACRRSTSPSSRRSLPSPTPSKLRRTHPAFRSPTRSPPAGCSTWRSSATSSKSGTAPGSSSAVRSAAAWSRTASAGATATWTVRTTSA